MPVSPRVHVELDLDPTPDPIAGWVTRPDGSRVEFSGWLELSTVVEAARDSTSQAQDLRRSRRASGAGDGAR